MKTGIYGGSFNPIHKGHIKLALTVIDELGLDRLIIIPTFSTPLKDNSDFADSAHRLDMCRLALSDYSNIEVSDIEIRREGNSYTYLTVNSIKELYPDDKLYLIVGADMFVTLDKWKYPKKIFRNASVVVVARNGGDYDVESKAEELRHMGCRSVIIPRTVCDISSTEIRNSLKANTDVGEYLDSRVLEYIKQNKLYGVI